MYWQSLALISVIFVTYPMGASARDRGIFAGADISGETVNGTSHTTDGGASFAGGGVVDDVRFGNAAGIGGHIGYRFSPAISVFISYQPVRGDIGWNANFPQLGVASQFKGSAVRNVIMGNVSYEWPLSDKTAIRGIAGLGMTSNKLSKIVETDVATGLFLSDVASDTKTSPVARIGAEIRYKMTSKAALGLNASVASAGGFETGDTRSGNLGVTDINPYRINDVWCANLGISLSFDF